MGQDKPRIVSSIHNSDLICRQVKVSGRVPLLFIERSEQSERTDGVAVAVKITKM